MNDKTVRLEAVTRTLGEEEAVAILEVPQGELSLGASEIETARETRRHFESPLNKFLGCIAAILDGGGNADVLTNILDDGLSEIAGKMNSAASEHGNKEEESDAN